MVSGSGSPPVVTYQLITKGSGTVVSGLRVDGSIGRGGYGNDLVNRGIYDKS